MRDYKQMQEIQKLKAQAETESAETETDQNEPEKDRYSHRSPGARGWWDYIKEYYKWPILIGVLALIGVGLGVMQIVSTSNPDLSVMYVGPGYISNVDRSNLEKSFSVLSGECAGDYNGDGSYKVDFLDLTIAVLTDADGKTYYNDEQNSAYTRFQTELRAGDAMLYFLQERFYKQAKLDGLLQPIAELGLSDEQSIDGYGIYLGELDAYELDGLSRMPADTIVCLRKNPSDEELSYERTESSWGYHRSLFCALLNYTSDRKPTSVSPDAPTVPILYVGSRPMISSFRIPAEQFVNSLYKTNANCSIRSIRRDGTKAKLALLDKQIRTELVTGNSMVWLLDAQAYAYAREKGLVAPLPDRLATSNAAIDEYGLRLSKLRIYNQEGFYSMEGDLILCLRRSPADEAESHGRTEEDYQFATEIFLRIAECEKYTK